MTTDSHACFTLDSAVTRISQLSYGVPRHTDTLGQRSMDCNPISCLIRSGRQDACDKNTVATVGLEFCAGPSEVKVLVEQRCKDYF